MFKYHRQMISGVAGLALSLGAASVHASDIQFTDVTASAGLSAESYGGTTRHSLGVVWLDVNNDGHLDIFATNGFNSDESGALRPHLYLGNATGTFTLADDLLPDFDNLEYAGAVAADYDRDGDIDIFVYTANEKWNVRTVEDNPYGGPPNLLLKNGFVENGNVAGPGLFTDVATAAGVDGCSARFKKVITRAERSSSVKSPHRCSQSRSASFFDYDLDGWIDLYLGQMVINRTSSDDAAEDAIGKRANMDVVYRNQGDGTFRLALDVLRAGDATNRGALVTRAGHLNDDMWPDIYVGNAGGMMTGFEEDLTDAILLNDGAGHLDLSHEYIGRDTPAAMGIAFGDVNQDGVFDIYITDAPTHPIDGTDPNTFGNTLYMSHETGFSSNVARPTKTEFVMSWGANFADFDRDGELDLFAAAARSDTSTQLGGDSAIFTDLQGWKTKRLDIATTNARGSALADYDGDGDHDILVVNQDGGLQLFRNDSVNPTAKSFSLDVIATRSNADVIGLRADLYTTSGKRLTQQITGGNSAHSQDDSTLIFGLGDDTIDRLEIRWPHQATPPQLITAINTESLTVTEPNLAD